MNKKIAYLFVSICLLFVLTSCGSDQDTAPAVEPIQPEAEEASGVEIPAVSVPEIGGDGDDASESEEAKEMIEEPEPTQIPEVAEKILEFEEEQAQVIGELNEVLSAEAERYLREDAPDYVTEASFELDPATFIKQGEIRNGKINRKWAANRFEIDSGSADNPFIYPVRYTFLLGEDGWVIEEADWQDDPFWSLYNFEVQQTDHFTLLTSEVDQASSSELLAEAETSYSQLQADGLEMEDQYIMIYAAEGEEFKELTRMGRFILGVAYAQYGFGESEISATNRAFYINGASFTNDQLADAERQSTITHELVHLVLSRHTRPFTPTWLAEGAAVYYADQVDAFRELYLAESLPEEFELVKLTEDDNLGQHDFFGTRAVKEYMYSGSLYAYLIETYGEAETLAFYKSFGEQPTSLIEEAVEGQFVTAFTMPTVMKDLRIELTPGLIEAQFGVTMEQLENDFEAWLFP